MLLINKNKFIETSSDDDFLYTELTSLLNSIRLTQGGTNLDASLKRHNKILYYLISKQIDVIRDIETTYFNDDGTLNNEAIKKHFLDIKSNHVVY